jgi:hypothetical protein
MHNQGPKLITLCLQSKYVIQYAFCHDSSEHISSYCGINIRTMDSEHLVILSQDDAFAGTSYGVWKDEKTEAAEGYLVYGS